MRCKYPADSCILVNSPAWNSTPTGQPQRNPVRQIFLAVSAVRCGVVGWQIKDAAMVRLEFAVLEKLTGKLGREMIRSKSSAQRYISTGWVD